MNHRHCYPFVVEDDDDFALFLRRALLKAGVPDGNIRRYRDGEGALADLITIDIIRPSVLVLDIELPGMSGLCLLERIRACERLADLPAFVLSGRADRSCLAVAAALGARGYWVKPHGNGTLQEIVAEILGSLEGVGHPMIPGNLLNRT